MHHHIREEWQGEADEAICSHLQQDACQDDRTGGRSLHVGIRQPGVKREHRNFDGEGQEKCQEQKNGERRTVRRIVED